jgi:hypothetical protein
MRKSKITQPVPVHELKITLQGSKPPIWRKVAVSSDMRLSDLHKVIQIVMGWTDSHLHQFIVSDRSRKEARIRGLPGYTHFDRCISSPQFELEDVEDESKIMLSELVPTVGIKFIYEYDFGDSWEHLIEVVKIGPPAEGVKYPVCLAGKLACPPDDCGGIGGYYSMLEAIKDPKLEDYEDMLAWVGEDFDPERFDIDEINASLAKEIQ